ncbi:MAG: T9SS type A sorting domain-containing protein [Saprospiraceae bacterium]
MVFPDELNVQNLELKITDVAGNIILQKNIKNGLGKLAVSAFPAGIYFVVLYGEGVFGRERFVKF